METIHYSFAVVKDHDDVLLVKRQVDPRFEDDSEPIWDFPGGTLRNSEVSIAAAGRHTFQQTGNYINIGEGLCRNLHQPERQRVASYWAAELFVPTAPRHEDAGSGIDEVKWVAIQSLNEYLRTPPIRDVARYLGARSLEPAA